MDFENIAIFNQENRSISNAKIYEHKLCFLISVSEFCFQNSKVLSDYPCCTKLSSLTNLNNKTKGVCNQPSLSPPPLPSLLRCSLCCCSCLTTFPMSSLSLSIL